MGFQTMAIPTQQAMTIQEFEEFIFHPDNINHHFEFVAGEIIEMVSNNYSSEIAAEILFLIRLHMKETDIKGRVTMADGGYKIGQDRYIPDVAFISWDKQPNSSHEAYNSNPPDLVVEVMSPTDTDKALLIKVANYLAVGTLVWVVRPDDKVVEIYETGQSVTLLNEDDTLEGRMVLPNFSMSVKDIFPPQRDTLETD
jgi:Uma2 family endonuclease